MKFPFDCMWDSLNPTQVCIQGMKFPFDYMRDSLNPTQVCIQKSIKVSLITIKQAWI